MEIILYIDTCTKYMCVGLSKNDKLLYNVKYEAFKKQSELAAIEINRCLEKCKVKPSEISKIVVTNGPGSYTGIRIGLTLAKVMSKVLNIKLVCLSTLQVLCGLGNCSAIIDAKAKRVYYGKYNEGRVCVLDCVKDIESLNMKEDYVGDIELIGLKNKKVDIIRNMYELTKINKEVEDIDSVKAIYLKD